MTFNEKTTALHLLEDSDPMDVGIDQSAADAWAAEAFLYQVFPGLRPCFRQRVQYLDQPCIETCLETQQDLLDLLMEEPVEEAGTFIFPVGGLGMQTTFYQLSARPCGLARRKIECMMMSFVSVGNRPQPILCYIIKISAGYYWAFDEFRLMKNGLTIMEMVESTLGMVLFARFCTQERKVIWPGQWAMHGNESYLNVSKRAVEVLGSRCLLETDLAD